MPRRPSPARSPLMDEVREIIRAQGRTVVEATKGTKLDRKTFYRWMTGENLRQLEELQAILRNHGHELRIVKARP
jgi:hypothetical protein